jgi:hypothetical protein
LLGVSRFSLPAAPPRAVSAAAAPAVAVAVPSARARTWSAPDPCGVHRDGSLYLEPLAGDLVRYPGTRHPGLAKEPLGPDVVGKQRAEALGGASHFDGQPGVVALALEITVTARRPAESRRGPTPLA